MKKAMMIAVMALCCLTANAQKMRHSAGSFTIQPMIGFSYGNLRGEYSTASGTYKYDNDDSRIGLAIGAEGEYYTSTPWFSVSAGLMYMQQGWKEKNVETAKVDYINIPILANFYVAKGFALKIGLQPGILVNAKEGSIDFKSNCNTFCLSLPLGLSYEFKNGITLDLRGAAALTNLNSKDNNVKWYADGGMLTVGYKFDVSAKKSYKSRKRR